MEEKENPVDEEETRTVYCPGCEVNVPLHDPMLFVEFCPHTTRMDMTGELDLGQLGDVFLDYHHLTCGTRVRVASHAGWSDELGEYVPSPSVMIEITVRGEDTVLYGEVLTEDENQVSPEVWGPTHATLLDAYQKACDLLMERLETES